MATHNINSDGRLKYVQDALNPKFDRLNIYDENGNLVNEEIEWQNPDSFGLSDLRTRKKGQAGQITGIDFTPMELDPSGTELQSRLSSGGGSGGTLDPEIPMLDPSTGEIGGMTNSDPNSYGGGSGAIAPLCVIYGSMVVRCDRVQLADGYGRSGSFAMLERMATYSQRQTGTRIRVRELVQGNNGRPPILRNGISAPPSGQWIASDGESILLGYEWWTEPIYGNDWSLISLHPQFQTQ